MKLPPWLWRVFASRRTRIALICSPFILSIGLVAFYAFMNWWGPRQFEKAVSELKAEGFAVTIEEALGSIPEDQDALKHPSVIAELSGTPTHKLQGLQMLPRFGFSIDPKVWECTPALGLRPEVTKWADPPRPGESEAEVAKHLLSSITAHSARFDSMREAFKRPQAQWVGGNNVNAPLRFSSLNYAPQFVGDRAVLKLASGDNDGAASDVVALTNLLSVLTRNPQAMGCLMAMVSEPKLSEVIWNGTDRGVWTDAHLREFQTALEQLDFQKTMVTSVDLDLTVMVARTRQSATYLNQLKENKDWDDLAKSFVRQSLQGDGAAVLDILRDSWQKGRPVGCDYLALIDHIRFVRSEREKAGVPPRTFLSPQNARKFIEATYETNGFQGYIYQMLGLFTKRTIHAETRLNLLRCGIALERYRLKYGTTPEKLEAVVPEFLAAVPLDVCDRQPLRYQRLPDGSPHVWSLWPSGKDEKGIPREKTERGNAVWTTGAIPGLTERVYRR